MHIVTLAGSPKPHSKSSSLLAYLSQSLQQDADRVQHFSIQDLHVPALLAADLTHTSIQALQAAVAQADGVIIASPVYKASFSGVLKTILDVLPQGALAYKTVLPVASGGSLAHLLALDYALKPVLSALKAQEILSGVFAVDSQIQIDAQPIILDTSLRERLDQAAQQFAHALRCRRSYADTHSLAYSA